MDTHRWWPTLPALLILYVGGSAFLHKYPWESAPRASRALGSRAPDSLVAFIRAGLRPDSVASRTSDSNQTVSRENPFRAIHQPKPASELAAEIANKPGPPPRKYVLKGTVGNNVATIANNAGQKLIVKIGDAVDSAVVVSIETNKVTLKDRAGKFDLLMEK